MPRIREHVSGFDRFWNSTFGLPQQYLMRLLRVIQDDRVSLFSKKGLFDMSLVPILGIFDNDRYDVGTQEKFDRTLGAMGVKDSLGARLATEVFTDPLTYLTAGVTAAGKAAAVAHKARRVRAVKMGLQDLPEEALTVGKLRDEIGVALRGERGILAPGERKLLEDARARMEEVGAGADESLISFSRTAGKREIQIGLPILSGYGAVLHRNPSYDGWTKFIMDKTKTSGVATSLVESTKGMVRQTPWLGQWLEEKHKTWRAFRDGLSTRGESLRAVAADKEFRGQNIRPLTPESRAIFLKVSERGAENTKRAYETALAEARRAGAAEPEWKAMEAALGKKLVKKIHHGPLWETLTGKALDVGNTPDAGTFAKAIDSFMDETASTVSLFNDAALTDLPTSAGRLQEAAVEGGHLKAFEVGRGIGAALRKVFVTDMRDKTFRAAEWQYRNAVAAAGQTIDARTVQLSAMRARAAAAVGMDPKEYDRRVLMLQEATSLQDELADRMLAIEAAPDSLQAAQALESFSVQMMSKLRSLRKLASGGEANPFDKQIMEALEPAFKQGLRDGDTIKAVMNGLHEVRDSWVPNIENITDAWGRPMLLTGSRKGRHLQFLDNSKLAQEQKRLKAALDSGEISLSRKVAAKVIGDIPEAAPLVSKHGLEPERAVDLLRSARRTERVQAKAAKVATELDQKADAVSMLARIESHFDDSARGLTESFEAFAKTEDKTLTQQMRALNILEDTVGEWRGEVAHIREQLPAVRKVGRRAGKLWDEAFSRPLEKAPVSIQQALDKVGAKYKIDRREVLAAMGQVDSKKYVIRVATAHSGDVPVEVADLKAARNEIARGLDEMTVEEIGEFDPDKFNLARKAVGAEDKVTRQLGELLKVREAEIAKWSKEIPKLREDIKAIQKEIRAAVRQKSADVRGGLQAKRGVQKELAKHARRYDKVVARLRAIKETITKQSSELSSAFGVPTEVVERVAQRASETLDEAMRVAHERDLTAVTRLLEKRRMGLSEYKVTPRASTMKTPLPARATAKGANATLWSADPNVDSLINEFGLDESGAKAAAALLGESEMVEVGEAMQNSLNLLVMAKEIKRAAKRGATVAPGLHRAVNAVIQANTDLLERAFYGAAGDAGKEYFDALTQVRKEIHQLSAESGLLTSGTPIAYSPRVKGFKESQILDQMLDDSEFYQLVDTSMPSLGPLFRRHRETLTVEDLNDLSRALDEAAGPKAKAYRALLDKFAEANGYSKGFQEYSDEALLNLMNRYAQAQRIDSTGEFAARTFLDGEDDGKLFMGRVVAVVSGAGEEVPVGRTIKPGAAKFDGAEVEVPISMAEETIPEARGFVVETASGRKVTVNAETMAGHRLSVVGLGQPDFSLYRRRALESGDTPGGIAEPAMAFAQLAARGQISAGNLKNTIDDAILGLKEGDYVAFGNRDALSSTLATISGQWHNDGAFLNGFDMAHHFVKRLQTVYRPAFLGANAVSAFPQSLLAGASPAAAMRGYWHAMRFMDESREFAPLYDAFTVVGNSAGEVKASRDPLEFLDVLRKNPTLKNVDWADEVAFKVGDQEYTFRELAPHLRPLLLSSNVREGLRGSSRISGTLTRLAEGKDALSKGQRVDEAVRRVSETSEVFNRLTTFFALVDDGMDLSMAGENALLAHVNYADLTNTERRVFKRVTGFYVWPRKMMPFIMRKFADDPALAARSAAFLRSGVIQEDENGNFAVDAGAFKAAVDRFNPSLDVLKMLETVGETMLGAGAAVGVGREASRQEDISGQTRSPFSAGGLTGIIYPMFGGRGDGAQQATEEAINTFWASRIIFGAMTGDTDRTMAEQVFEQIVPVKVGTATSDERRRRVLRGRTAAVIRDLERRAERTTDLDLQMRIYEQIGRLQEYSFGLEQK